MEVFESSVILFVLFPMLFKMKSKMKKVHMCVSILVVKEDGLFFCNFLSQSPLSSSPSPIIIVRKSLYNFVSSKVYTLKEKKNLLPTVNS